MVPVVPPSGRNNVVEVGIREDDPRVLSHGAPHVEPAGAGDLAVHEGEASFLAGAVPVLSSDGPEAVRDGMELAVLRDRS